MVRFASGGKVPFFFRMLGKVAFSSQAMSPFTMMRMMGKTLTKKLINRYVNRMQKTGSEEEAAALKEYLFQIFLLPGSTEFAVFHLFDQGLHAHIPLNDERRLARNDLPFPVSFIYGEQDWMDSRGADNIVRTSQFFRSGQSQMHLVPAAGHQVFQDQPEEFCALLNLDLKGGILHQMQVRRPTVRYMHSSGQFVDYETGQVTEAAQELPPYCISMQAGVIDETAMMFSEQIVRDTSSSNLDSTQENQNAVAENQGDSQCS